MKTGLEAVLLANRSVSFTTKEGELVSYNELTFLIEDQEGNAKPLILRPKNSDIKDLKPAFKEVLEGNIVHGSLIVEYVERKDNGRVVYVPKYISFNIEKAKK